MFSVDRYRGSDSSKSEEMEPKDTPEADKKPESALLSKLAAKVSARKRSRAEIGTDGTTDADKQSASDAAALEDASEEPSRKRAAIEAAAAKTAVAAIGNALRASVDLNAATRRGIIRSGALALVNSAGAAGSAA